MPEFLGKRPKYNFPPILWENGHSHLVAVTNIIAKQKRVVFCVTVQAAEVNNLSGMQRLGSMFIFWR
jgi:hypothetical protein